MNRVLKWLLSGLAVFVFLVVVIALTLPAIIDPNDYREDIEGAVTANTGLPFTIEGEIAWSVFPWVGFEAGPLELGNAPGFSEDHLARIESIAVRVRLIPLFSGRVEAGTVVLRGTDLRAEVNAAGQGNWETIIETTQSGGQDEKGESASEGNDNLRIAGLEISESRLSYSGPDGKILTVSELELNTGPISRDQPITADLSMAIASQALPGPARLSTSITANLAGQAEVEVQTLTIELEAGKDLPARFELTKPLVWRADSDAIELAARASAGDMVMSLAARVADLAGVPSINAQLSMPTFDPRPLVQAVTGEPLVLADPSALSTLALDARLVVAGERASLQDLSLRFDETTVKVDLVLESVADLRGTLNGSIDTLDLDRYLAASDDAEAAPGSDKPLTADDLVVPGNLTGALEVGRLKVMGLTAENTRIELFVRNGGFRLYPLTADLYGGTMNGALVLKPAGQDYRVVFKNTLKNIDAGPLLQDLAGQPVLGGRGTLAFELNIADPLAEQPLRTADGVLQIRFNDGAIYGVNVMGMIRQATALFGGGKPETGENKTDFGSLVVSADIVDGVLTTNRMDLKAPFFNVTGAGSFDLAASTMDYTVTPVLTAIPEGLGSGTLAKFKDKPIDVRLTGSMFAPTPQYDKAKLALALTGGKVDGAAGDLLEALTGDSPEGEESKPGDALLNALLNEASKRSDKKPEKKDGSE